MIVKDESAVIERSLRSVRGLIDYWVICDTGSTDGTQALIRAALEGIPGELHEREWVRGCCHGGGRDGDLAGRELDRGERQGDGRGGGQVQG